MMFPEEFVQRIKSQEYIDADGLLKALDEPSPVSIRINPSKWNRKPLNSSPVQWCKTGFYLEKRPSYTLDPLFHAGCYYPQEASGMFIEQVFKQVVNSDEYVRVLDLCAAPGGKSTHLSSLIGSRGLLVANETIKTRAAVLSENISKWGNTNTIITNNDPSAFSALPGFFDVILTDAPCSGEGMFRDPVAVNEWSEENAIHCSERQKRILSDVWPALRENATLIYSTCTFNPGENEENVKWLLTNHAAEIIKLNTSDFKDITEIDNKGITGYGFYPGKLKGEGLFISLIRKTGNLPKVKTRIKRKHVIDIKRSDLEIVKEWTTFPSENILKSGEEIFSFAGKIDDFTILQDCMKIIRKGTRICTAKKNNYIPAHELALSDSFRREAFQVAELEYNQAVAYLRRDNFLTEGMPQGWFTAIYKGVNLGFCNNIGSRINNYYPVDRRIRMSILEPGTKNIIFWDC